MKTIKHVFTIILGFILVLIAIPLFIVGGALLLAAAIIDFAIGLVFVIFCGLLFLIALPFIYLFCFLIGTSVMDWINKIIDLF